MFGFKLVRLKKADLKELSNLKQSVQIIFTQVDMILETVRSYRVVNLEMYVTLMSQTSILDAHVKMYTNNKFASPSNMISMEHAFGSVTNALQKMRKILQQDAYTYENQQEIAELIAGIYQSITLIKIAANYDKCRIDAGIDIIGSYYKNQKQIKDCGNEAICYTIRFVQSNTKEENKHGYTGVSNGNGDNGLSEKV